jgi:protein-disulfide isomerase
MLVASLALSGAMNAVSQLSARAQAGARERTQATQPATAPEASLFAGIPQRGAALGWPQAPVTLVEYADLQCPYCAEWARRTLPQLVSRYVERGKLRIVFRGLAFIGPDSQLALETAVAAGRKEKLWHVVDELFLRQGAENGGWVDDALLARVAAGAGLDYEDVAAERTKPWVAREIATSANAATAAGVAGTPAFELGPTGGRLELLELHSLGPEGIVPAIEAVLARE